MGGTDCPKHGLQGFYEMCEHVHEKLEKGIFPNMLEVSVNHMKLCKSCWEKGNFQYFEKYDWEKIKHALSFEEQDSLTGGNYYQTLQKFHQSYTSLNRSMMCCVCFYEIKLKHARLNEEKDPFEAYEFTLLHENREVIDELNLYLKSNFSFEKRLNTFAAHKEAFYITPGTIVYPLEIVVYYVIDKSDQEKILKLLDAFFKNKRLSQRVIKFYEDEIKETYPDGGFSFKEGKLLAQHWIK
ncbi:MAG: hypothetical protein ACJ75J_07185 [Cytophagaceae bacterium]